MVKEVVSRSTAAMREGSNPSSPKRSHRLVVKTSDFDLAKEIREPEFDSRWDHGFGASSKKHLVGKAWRDV